MVVIKSKFFSFKYVFSFQRCHYMKLHEKKTDILKIFFILTCHDLAGRTSQNTEFTEGAATKISGAAAHWPCPIAAWFRLEAGNVGEAGLGCRHPPPMAAAATSV